MSSSTPADRKESYKAQRKNYAKQKKRVGKELLSTFKDQSIIVLADWLKVRRQYWCNLTIEDTRTLRIDCRKASFRTKSAKDSRWLAVVLIRAMIVVFVR